MVAAFADDGVEVIEFTDPSNPTGVGRLGNSSSRELNGARGIALHSITASGGTKRYALVAAFRDNGVQIIEITDPTNPTARGKVEDNTTHELAGAYNIDTYETGGKHYAVVTGNTDNGVNIIDFSNPASPSIEDEAEDGVTFQELVGPRGIEIRRIGGNHYAFVAADGDDGVQIINVSDPDNVSNTAAMEDGDDYPTLNGARGITTHTIGGRHYALVASYEDDGVQIIDVTTPGTPSAVSDFTDGSGGFRGLQGATRVATARIGGIDGRIYAFVVGGSANSVQVIDFTDPARPYSGPRIRDGSRRLYRARRRVRHRHLLDRGQVLRAGRR